MEKKTKIFVGIGLGLVAAVGTYLLITKAFKKKADETDVNPELPETKTATPDTSNKPAAGSGIHIKKPTKKPTGFDKKPAAYNPKATVMAPVKPAPAAIKSIAQAGAPAIGTKVYAFTDVNIYKEGKASNSSIIKFNKKGTFLGTYLGASPNGFTRLIVENDNPAFAATRKMLGISKPAYVVFVLSKQVYAQK